eukprot:2333999-Prymnesium_polylepis.1
MLTESADDPMRPPPRAPGWEPDDEEGEGEDDEDDENDVPEVEVHPTGLGRRVYPVPMAPARLEQLSVLWDDVLLFTKLEYDEGDPSEPPEHGHSNDDEKGTLMRYELGSGRLTSLIDDVLEYALSADLGTMAALLDESGDYALRAFEAGAKPPEQDDDDNDVDADTPGALSGLVDVDGRVTLSVDARHEWRQMFYEGWAATAAKVHPSCVEGLDMEMVLRAYAPLLARVGCVEELHDLMNEMQGELGASHAGVGPADSDEDVEGTQGFLGVSTAWDATRHGWRITRALRGSPWDERAAPPLARPGGAAEGDVLLAINGRRLMQVPVASGTVRRRVAVGRSVLSAPHAPCP